MKYLKHVKFDSVLVLGFLILANCTFGSIGNSTNDRAAEWQALYKISDERRTFISPWIYYSDDQADANLGDFTVSGASTSYNVQLTANSVTLESLSLLFSPPDSLLPFGTSNTVAILSSGEYTAFHSGDGGSTPVGTGSYAVRYGIEGSFDPGDISASDLVTLTGPVRSQSLSPFPPVPYGTLAHIFGEYSEILLTFTIQRQSDSSTKTLHLELREAEIEVEPSCELAIPYTKSTPFSIGFRTDGLLSIRPGSSFSLLDAIFSLSGSEITINNFQNPTLYSEVLSNLDEPGHVLVFYSCL